MERLPNEILAHIFSNLDFCDKEECIFVCRLWSDVIYSTVLFETLPISGGYIFRKYQRYLDSQPAAKAQVKSLLINPVVSNRYISGSLQECFPKLRSLYVQTCSHQPLTDDNDNQSSQTQMDFIIPISKIEILEQYDCSAPSQCFLSLGVYKSLKKLVINKNGNDRAMNFALLMNAPNLISLTLGNVEISTNNLETIHSNLLYLKSLELNDITLVSPNKDITAEFSTPPDYLTTLLITTRHNNANQEKEQILECLHYIRQKYERLLEFRFIIDSTVPITVEVEEAIFNNGILPILPHLNRRLKLLEINCSVSLRFLFEIMDKLLFKQHCLNILLSFGPSRYDFIRPQGNYKFIQKLTLDINNARLIPDVLEKINSFKTLHIKGMHSFVRTRHTQQCTIKIEDIFTLCSDSLDHLIIDTYYVNSYAQTQLHSLTQLEIHSRSISTPTHRFISRCLPQLRYLKLNYQRVVGGVKPLENLNLKRLDLIVPRNTLIVIRTVSDDKYRHFLPKTGFLNTSNPTHCLDLLRKLTPEEINSCGRFSAMIFELNSVQELFINNMFTHL